MLSSRPLPASSSPKDAKDASLWKEARDQEVTLKRNASFSSLPDDSPVSVDALFHEPMVPHKTEAGESGWLVSVGDDEDEVEMMPELASAPVASVAPIAVPRAAPLPVQRARERVARARHVGGAAAEYGELARELDHKLHLLREEREWHLTRARELEGLIWETAAAAEAAGAQRLNAGLEAVVGLLAKPATVVHDDEEISCF